MGKDEMAINRSKLPNIGEHAKQVPFFLNVEIDSPISCPQTFAQNVIISYVYEKQTISPKFGSNLETKNETKSVDIYISE